MAVIVSTDKDTYGKTSFAKISVRVKNTGDRVLKRVHADWVISDNASLVSKNSMVFDAEALSPGELLESDIEICLSPDRANINLFHKFILKIKLFFRAITGSQALPGPAGAPPENEQSLTLEDTSKDILFGGETVRLSVRTARLKDITLTKTGDTYAMESPFNKDKTIRIEFGTSSSMNGGFRWNKTTISTDFSCINKDDITPFRIGLGAVGANHGYWTKYTVSAPGHNKTAAHLGGVWRSGRYDYTLIGFENGTGNLIFVGPYTETNGIVTPVAVPPSGDMAYIKGGEADTDLENITVSGVIGSNGQIYPSVNHVSVDCYLDGLKIEEDGVYYGDTLEIKESYTIMCYKEMLEYAQTHNGDYCDESIGGVVRMENIYIYTAGLDCVIESTVEALKKMASENYGAVQAICIGRTGYVTKRFMPGVKPKEAVNAQTGEKAVFDFAHGVDMQQYNDFFSASAQNGLRFGPADCVEESLPPNHNSDWIYNTSGNRTYGFAMGVFPDQTDAGNTARRQSCGDYWFMSQTKKSYPFVTGKTVFNPGESRTFKAFRNYLDPAASGSASAVIRVKDDGAEYIYIDGAGPVSGETVKLPGLEGKTVTIVQSESFELLTDTVGTDGLRFNITAGEGNAVLKAAG